MLILSRREAESISLGDDIVVTIVAVGNDKVRIGVKAPPEVRVLRSELEIKQQTIPFPASPKPETALEPPLGKIVRRINPASRAA